MNKIILVIILSFSLNTTISNAAPIGSAFSYQGELLDGGTPANGSYDIIIDAYDEESAGNQVGGQGISGVSVSNGLITIPEVDFGDATYNGDEVWLEVSVRPAGGGSYTVLAPRQRVAAVPYAVQAEFLSDDGTADIQQWDENGATLISPSRVGVGEPTPSAQLHVTNNAGQISLLKVDDVSDTRMVVQATGRVGIGPTNPAARLHINSDAGEDPLRVQVDNATKLRLWEHGGLSVGSNFTGVPIEGLYVKGDTMQLETSKGMLKYMFRATCDATPTIDREFNGTNVVGTASITFNSTGNCTIALPISLATSYTSVSAVWAGAGTKLATCASIFSGMVCTISTASGSRVDSTFEVLVY